MPGASMLTKVIIMAASGKAGLGRSEWRSSARVLGDSSSSSRAIAGWQVAKLGGAFLACR